MRHRIPVFALCISLLLSCTESYDVVVVGGGTGRSVGWANETWVNLPENE